MPLRFFKEPTSRRQAEVPPAAVPPRGTVSGAKSNVRPPHLRPLMLVARQEARALEDAARRAADVVIDEVVPLPRPLGMPLSVPVPQLFTGPPVLVPGRVSVRPNVSSGGPPLPQSSSPTSVTYNVNDRIERARALRIRGDTATVALGDPVRPPPARPPGPVSELPYLSEAQTADDRHQHALEAMRNEGHVLPDLLRQAARGQPLMVPPRRSSHETAARKPPSH